MPSSIKRVKTLLMIRSYLKIEYNEVGIFDPIWHLTITRFTIWKKR